MKKEIYLVILLIISLAVSGSSYLDYLTLSRLDGNISLLKGDWYINQLHVKNMIVDNLILEKDTYMNDDVYMGFGTAKNARISYNGTDLKINPQVVGSGDIIASSGAFKGDHKSSDGSAGITQSETGVTDFDIVIKDGLITSFTKNN